MLNLPGATWVRFLVWMAIGLVVYFAYGARKSRLGLTEAGADGPDTGAGTMAEPGARKVE
jgi:APA family basic amino acid/polyamine antiporter